VVQILTPQARYRQQESRATKCCENGVALQRGAGVLMRCDGVIPEDRYVCDVMGSG
jgi:hypothetical protein